MIPRINSLYSFNPKLRDYGRPIGFDVFHGDERDILRMPLVNQPGSKWEYGVNIDWAGIVLERATGSKLNDLIQTGIISPLGLKNITMFPTPAMKQNLATMHQRWPNDPSKSEERDHILREPLVAETDEEKAKLFHSGGAGAYAQPSQYVQVLAALLNDGKSPKNGARILKPETVHLMFENQIPQHPDFAREGLTPAKAEYSNAAPEMYPQEGKLPPLKDVYGRSIADDPSSRKPTSRLGSQHVPHARAGSDRPWQGHGLVGRYREPVLVV